MCAQKRVDSPDSPLDYDSDEDYVVNISERVALRHSKPEEEEEEGGHQEQHRPAAAAQRHHHHHEGQHPQQHRAAAAEPPAGASHRSAPRVGQPAAAPAAAGAAAAAAAAAERRERSDGGASPSGAGALALSGPTVAAHLRRNKPPKSTRTITVPTFHELPARELQLRNKGVALLRDHLGSRIAKIPGARKGGARKGGGKKQTAAAAAAAAAAVAAVVANIRLLREVELPADVRRYLSADGTSSGSEDTADEAYLGRHAAQEQEEREEYSSWVSQYPGAGRGASRRRRGERARQAAARVRAEEEEAKLAEANGEDVLPAAPAAEGIARDFIQLEDLEVPPEVAAANPPDGRIPALPMVMKLQGLWYRARVVDWSEEQVCVECCGFEAAFGLEWLDRTSPRCVPAAARVPAAADPPSLLSCQDLARILQGQGLEVRRGWCLEPEDPEEGQAAGRDGAAAGGRGRRGGGGGRGAAAAAAGSPAAAQGRSEASGCCCCCCRAGGRGGGPQAQA